MCSGAGTSVGVIGDKIALYGKAAGRKVTGAYFFRGFASSAGGI
jgi:hypothetical protein